MTGRPVVTQLNTQEAVVGKPYITILFIFLQVCMHECVWVHVVYDGYEVLVVLSVGVFVCAGKFIKCVCCCSSFQAGACLPWPDPRPSSLLC